MGKKGDKVDVQNSKDTLQTARTSAWYETGGKIQSPILRQLLIGLCVAQMIMIAVSSATLGAFVNSNAHEISLLIQTTDTMQVRINQLESKIDSVPSTSFGHSVDNDTTLEEAYTETVQDNITEEYDARMMQLETDNLIMNDTIISLEAKTAKLEIARATDLEKTETLNNTLAQFILDTTFERAIGRVSIQKLNESVVELALGETVAEVVIGYLNESINNIESNSIDNREDIQSIYANISNLEKTGDSNLAVTKMLDTTIALLQTDFGTQSQVVTDLNLTLSKITDDVITNTQSIENASNTISALYTTRQEDVAKVSANSEKLFQLINDTDATRDLYFDLESRVSHVEDSLDCIWRYWASFSNCYAERIQYSSFIGLWCSNKDLEFPTCNSEQGDIRTTSQSSNHSNDVRPAHRAVDGDFDTLAVSAISPLVSKPWWMLEYECNKTFIGVVVTNRKDCCPEQLRELVIYVDDQVCGQLVDPLQSGESRIVKCSEPLIGKRLKIEKQVEEALVLAEVMPVLRKERGSTFE